MTTTTHTTNPDKDWSLDSLQQQVDDLRAVLDEVAKTLILSGCPEWVEPNWRDLLRRLSER